MKVPLRKTIDNIFFSQKEGQGRCGSTSPLCANHSLDWDTEHKLQPRVPGKGKMKLGCGLQGKTQGQAENPKGEAGKVI